MKDLLAFERWAKEKGHYQTLTSINSWFKLQESKIEGTSNTSQGTKVPTQEGVQDSKDHIS